MNLVSGLDLVEIHRISSLKTSIKERFIQRILTVNERKEHLEDRSIAGIFAAKETFLLAKKYAIDMPITEQTYKVLYEGLAPRTAVQNLLAREQKAES